MRLSSLRLSMLAAACLALGGCLVTLPKQTPLTSMPMPAVPPSTLASQLPAANEGTKAATVAATDAKSQAGHLQGATQAIDATLAAVAQAKQAVTDAGPAVAQALPPLVEAAIKAAVAKQEVAAAAPSAEQYLALTNRTLDLAARLKDADEAVRARDVVNATNLGVIASRDTQIAARQAELEDLRTTLELPVTAAPGEARQVVRERAKEAKETGVKLTAAEAQWAAVLTHLKLAPTASEKDVNAAFDHEQATRQLAESKTFQRIVVVASLILVACIGLIIWVPLVRGMAVSVAAIAGLVIVGSVAAIHDIAWCDEHPEYFNGAIAVLVLGAVGYLLYLARKHALSAGTLKGIVAGVEQAATNEEPAVVAAATTVKEQISAQFAPGSAARLEVDRVRHEVAAEADKGQSWLKRFWNRLCGLHPTAGTPA